jgi:hypothetical protein
MLNRSMAMAGLIFLLLLSTWVSSGWAQPDLRFEQHSPEVEKYWQKKIQRHPRDSRAYFHLGRHYEYTGGSSLPPSPTARPRCWTPAGPKPFFIWARPTGNWAATRKRL